MLNSYNDYLWYNGGYDYTNPKQKDTVEEYKKLKEVFPFVKEVGEIYGIKATFCNRNLMLDNTYKISYDHGWYTDFLGTYNKNIKPFINNLERVFRHEQKLRESEDNIKKILYSIDSKLKLFLDSEILGRCKIFSIEYKNNHIIEILITKDKLNSFSEHKARIHYSNIVSDLFTDWLVEYITSVRDFIDTEKAHYEKIKSLSFPTAKDMKYDIKLTKLIQHGENM